MPDHILEDAPKVQETQNPECVTDAMLKEEAGDILSALDPAFTVLLP